MNQDLRDAGAQLHTGHQDIRSYFTDATLAAAAPDVNNKIGTVASAATTKTKTVLRVGTR
jgi:hypothetical protein